LGAPGAAAFPDGDLYVNLRGYDAAAPVSPNEALDGFLRALSVPVELIPPGWRRRQRCIARCYNSGAFW
jgi:hypothetical protein